MFAKFLMEEMDEQVDERSCIKNAVEAIEQTAVTRQEFTWIFNPDVSLDHRFDEVAKGTCDADDCCEKEHENQFKIGKNTVNCHRKN